MQILEIEEQKNVLQQKLEDTFSSRRKLILISEFYSSLLNSEISINTIEPYIAEFAEEFSNCLEHYYVFGIHPNRSQKIIDLTKRLINLECIENKRNDLQKFLLHLEEQFDQLKRILNGNEISNPKIKKAFFPVLVDNESEFHEVFGLLESATVKINLSKTETKFIIVPSDKVIEKRIQEQIKNSWQTAKGYVKKYIRKINENHEVIISFDKRVGVYVGNSLGVALTISFIEELLSFYNSTTIVEINEGIAFTGSSDAQGSVNKVSKEIVEQKTETVFYSDITTFVVPGADQIFAMLKVKELQKQFPARNIKLVGVETFDDILNLRSLVDIRKQKITLRVYKFSKRNWASLMLLFILAVVIAVSGIIDFDSNPVMLENRGYTVYVKNKNEKVLWSKKLTFDASDKNNKQEINFIQKIVDINNDGKNEVILTSEDLRGSKDENDFLRVACFDNKNKLIWRYNFRDSVETIEGLPEQRYRSELIDTVTESGIKVLYLYSIHNIIYPSAVFKLNLQTGKRLKGTLWSQGHFAGALISDFNNDGKKELVGVGINNGLERCFILSINLNEINGQTPTTDQYYYLNKRLAKFNNYVLLPKSDYNYFFKERFNVIPRATLAYQKDTNKFVFGIYEGEPANLNTFCGYTIHMGPQLNDIDIYIGDEFHVRRDSLVAKRLLNPPYTNTSEFVEILKSQMLYWNGEKFETRKNFVK